MAGVGFVNDKSRDWCTAKAHHSRQQRPSSLTVVASSSFPRKCQKREKNRVSAHVGVSASFCPHSPPRPPTLTVFARFRLSPVLTPIPDSSNSSPSLVQMLLKAAAVHRRNATLDLPSPRIPDFAEPEPSSPRFFPLPASSSTKFSRSRFTVNQSLISRRWLQRTTFLALFSLFSVSVYVLLVNGSSNLRPAAAPPQIKSPFQAAMNTIVDSPDHPWRPSHKDVIASRPQITLTPEEELAALSSFIISLPDQNILPPSVDPSKPIDPQLILDFDTRTDGAEDELKRLVAATWEYNPVVMYIKVLSSLSVNDRRSDLLMRHCCVWEAFCCCT